MFLDAKKYFWVLLVLVIVALLLPMFLRSEGLFIGEESYRSIRLADQVEKDPYLSKDDLSYGGKPIFEEKGWYWLLSLNPELLARILPFIFGVLSFVLFYFIVRKLKWEFAGLTSLLLIVSPSFLYLFSTVSKYTAAIFFILLGFYLMVLNKRWGGLLSFFISGFFSIFGLFFVVLFMFRKATKSQKYGNFSFLFAGLIFLFVIQFYNLILYSIPKVFFGFTNFTIFNFVSKLFFEFGGKIGVFVFLLSLVGIYIHFKEKFKFIGYYILMILLLLLGFYINFVFILFIFIIPFFAAEGITFFFYSEWRSDLLKFLTGLVLCCGILFSFLLFYNQINGFSPTSDYFDGISYLKNQEVKATVLSEYWNGEYINYAGKISVINEDVVYAPDFEKRIEYVNTLFKTKDIEGVSELLKEYDIDYILIDKKMKEEVFNNRVNNFLYALIYGNTNFVKNFDNGEVQIWYVRPI